MRAGLLVHRVTIEQKQVARDATFGSEVITWVDFAADLPAKVTESATEAEYLSGSLSAYARPTRVRLRYLDGVTTAMRVNWGGRLLAILGTASVFEDVRRVGLELSCKEWTTSG